MAFLAGQKLRAGDLGQLTTSAQYTGAADQTISNTTDTPVAFGTADYTSSYVTRSVTGVGHRFTFNVSGLWAVSTTVRWRDTGVTVGEKHAHVIDSLGLWHASSSIPGLAGSDITNHLSFVKYLEAGDYIEVTVWQNSGGTEDLQFNALWGVPRINLALLLAS